MSDHARRLMEEGLVTHAALRLAEQRASAAGVRPETALVMMELLDESVLADRLPRWTRLPLADRKRLASIPPALLGLMPAGWLGGQRLLPFAEEGPAVCWAMTNPDPAVIARVERQTKRPVKAFILPETWFFRAASAPLGVRPPQVAPPPDDPALRPRSAAIAPDGAAPADEEELTDPDEFYNMFGSSGGAWAPAKAPSPPPAEEEVLDLMEEMEDAPRPAPPAPALPVLPLAPSEAAGPIADAPDKEALARLMCRAALHGHARSLVFVVREAMAFGWDGLGDGLNADKVQSLMLPLSIPSMLQTAYEAGGPFLGPVERSALTERFYKVLGGDPPASALVVPVRLGTKVVNLLYCDNGPGQTTAGGVAELQLVAAGATRVYQRLIAQARTHRSPEPAA